MVPFASSCLAIVEIFNYGSMLFIWEASATGHRDAHLLAEALAAARELATNIAMEQSVHASRMRATTAVLLRQQETGFLRPKL